MKKIIHRNLINEQVYAYIKDRIINNDLKPNEKIDVFQLASDLNVSKTPVSAALTRLQHDGYVTILPQSGTFVRSHSVNELFIIYKSRACLEKAIVETYADQYNRDELQKMRSDFLEFANVPDLDKAQEKLFAKDLQFHGMLISFCEEVIRSNVINIADLTKRSRLQYFRMARDKETNLMRIRRNVRTHCDIIDALLDGKREEAGQLVYEDIIYTFDSVKNFV